MFFDSIFKTAIIFNMLSLSELKILARASQSRKKGQFFNFIIFPKAPFCGVFGFRMI